jgi:hypothetical protein
MSAENKPLKRTSGNIVGPNYYNKTKDEYEIVEGSNGSINMQLTGSNMIQPVDIQARLSQTIQTHSGVVVAPAGNGVGAYFDCDGFDKVGITFSCSTAPTANDKLYINVDWSNDGTSHHGLEVMPVKMVINLTRSAGILEVKARYCRIVVVNVDTPPHTVNAFAYLKA